MTLTLTPAPPMNPQEVQAEARRLADQAIEASAADDGKEAITVRLPARFADYLRLRAEAHGDTPENHLATIMRAFWQNDPWRLTDTRPRDMDQPAGSGRR